MRWICARASRRTSSVNQSTRNVVARFPSPQPSPASGRGGTACMRSPASGRGECGARARRDDSVGAAEAAMLGCTGTEDPMRSLRGCRTLPLTPTLSRKRERGNSGRAAEAGKARLSPLPRAGESRRRRGCGQAKGCHLSHEWERTRRRRWLREAERCVERIAGRTSRLPPMGACRSAPCARPALARTPCRAGRPQGGLLQSRTRCLSRMRGEGELRSPVPCSRIKRRCRSTYRQTRAGN